ncbi:general transcriptional corepressor CYC8 [Nematocida minor]|uniref:general transcriptional corepressor CYC8 n=1 Tax=Nematocida minor TaxID=1912983 RepID=UPI00221ED7B8|nr:general transcriptional corepressor CYC8 [Nematocida minor]KAI5191115.1 general transcriptional corepressor CYC8 [Nematocida minor]
MDNDTKINPAQESWKDLPGMESVPQMPRKTSMDLYTRLLLDNEASWIAMANLFRECNMEKNICFAYEKALANNPLSRDALAMLGPIYIRRREFMKALDVFLRLYKLSHGEDIQIAINIAYCYLMLDRFLESLAWYKMVSKNASQIKERKGFLWYGVGVFYERINNLQIAEEAYAASIKIDHTSEYIPEVYFRLGVTYKKKGALTAAMDCFEYLLHNISSKSHNPTKDDVLVQIAHANELHSRESEAIDILKGVTQLNPRHEKASMLLAWLYYKERNWLSARDVLKSHRPEALSAFSWYLLARTEQKLENYEDAYRCYHYALKQDSQNHIYWNSLGVLYFNLSQFEDAMRSFKEARKHNPGYIEAVYNLGVVYEQFESALGSALEIYEEAISIFPEDRLVLERIEELEERNSGNISEEKYCAPELPLRDVLPNPGKTPYFLAHALLGYRPTGFIFSAAEKEEIENLADVLHSESDYTQETDEKE